MNLEIILVSRFLEGFKLWFIFMSHRNESRRYMLPSWCFIVLTSAQTRVPRTTVIRPTSPNKNGKTLEHHVGTIYLKWTVIRCGRLDVLEHFRMLLNLSSYLNRSDHSRLTTFKTTVDFSPIFLGLKYSSDEIPIRIFAISLSQTIRMGWLVYP